MLDQSRIKDLRTGFETGNTKKVLDGDLDDFISASLSRACKPMTQAQRAFIFDMDGTIVDYMAFHTESWLAFFARRGKTYDPTFFRETAGAQGREILRERFGADSRTTRSPCWRRKKTAVPRDLRPAPDRDPGLRRALCAAAAREA